MVNIVFVMEGEDILGNAHTMDAIIIYLGANFVPNTMGERVKVAQHRGSGHSTTGKLHPAKAGIRSTICSLQGEITLNNFGTLLLPFTLIFSPEEYQKRILHAKLA